MNPCPSCRVPSSGSAFVEGQGLRSVCASSLSKSLSPVQVETRCLAAGSVAEGHSHRVRSVLEGSVLDGPVQVAEAETVFWRYSARTGDGFRPPDRKNRALRGQGSREGSCLGEWPGAFLVEACPFSLPA